jgi:type I restriction enzyme R subunit
VITGALKGPRPFEARLELVSHLDGGVHPSEPDRGVRTDIANLLRDQVAGMNLNNIIVRPQRRWVQTYVDLANWDRLSPAVVVELGERLAVLPTSLRDEDEQAKRFGLLMLRLQLAALGAEPGFDRFRAQVQAIAAALLEQLRRRVRSLVKLIEKAKRMIVYTDLGDQIGDITEMPLSGMAIPDDFERFRAKARVCLRGHNDHVALQRLRRNRALTPDDLTALETMLTDAGVGTPADIALARTQAHGRGLFICSLVGLDRAAANEALDAFIAGRTLTASQLDFTNLVVAELTANGGMDPARLYESPFIERAPQGPESLSSGADIDQPIAVLDSVRTTAAPDEIVA